MIIPFISKINRQKVKLNYGKPMKPVNHYLEQNSYFIKQAVPGIKMKSLAMSLKMLKLWILSLMKTNTH